MALSLVAAPLWASEAIPGADTPAFTQALDLWLADDEAAALTALAPLAQDGNAAARLLLGLIDKSPALQGTFLAHLPRAERLALLRAPGGMSGRSWLSDLDLPLAATWRTMLDVTATPEVIAGFAALGEPRAAREAMTVLSAREHPGLARLDAHQADPETLYLLWRAHPADQRGAILALVPAEHPQRALMGEPAPEALDAWLASAEATAPLAALCAQACPADPAPCRVAAYRALASHDAAVTLGTPAEALIAQARFNDSPRGRASVLRRILLATPMRGRRAALGRIGEASQCLGDAVQAEAQRYRPSRPGAPDNG